MKILSFRLNNRPEWRLTASLVSFWPSDHSWKSKVTNTEADFQQALQRTLRMTTCESMFVD